MRHAIALRTRPLREVRPRWGFIPRPRLRGSRARGLAVMTSLSHSEGHRFESGRAHHLRPRIWKRASRGDAAALAGSAPHLGFDTLAGCGRARIGLDATELREGFVGALLVAEG